MLLRAKEVGFEVEGNRKTSGILLFPASVSSETGIVIAHGAGNDMNAPLISAFAEGLSRAGYVTFRFNFIYREEGRRTPDREEVLAATWLAAYRYFTESSDIKVKSVVAAGKSLGGRVAAQLTADNRLPADRLVFLGYPLHPAGSPDKMKDRGLHRIRVPMLFFAGTRDPLCNLDRLKFVLGRLRTDWELSVIEGGDHSFHVPKSMTVNETDIERHIVEKTIEWLQG